MGRCGRQRPGHRQPRRRRDVDASQCCVDRFPYKCGYRRRENDRELRRERCCLGRHQDLFGSSSRAASRQGDRASSSEMSSLAQIKALANAIAKAEGFGIEGAIPTLAHNPGDLCLGDRGLGVLGEGVTVFPDDSVGWIKLYAECEMMLSGNSHIYSPQLTLAQVGMRYSGGNPDWAKNVAAALGVDGSITLADLAKG